MVQFSLVCLGQERKREWKRKWEEMVLYTRRLGGGRNGLLIGMEDWRGRGMPSRNLQVAVNVQLWTWWRTKAQVASSKSIVIMLRDNASLLCCLLLLYVCFTELGHFFSCYVTLLLLPYQSHLVWWKDVCTPFYFSIYQQAEVQTNLFHDYCLCM